MPPRQPPALALRRAMVRRLPRQIRALLADYDAFLAAAPPEVEDVKTWAARHGAGKAALQHIDMLLKLLRWAEAGEAAEPEPGSPPPAADDLGGLLARARAALGQEGEEDDDDDDDEHQD